MNEETHPSVLVQDTGFVTDDWQAGFSPADAAAANGVHGVDLPSDIDPANLPQFLNAPIIRIDFPSFANGKGFTLAQRLRSLGYTGRLRAHGHVLADQYAMARRSGFDEVEIPAEIASRQPEAQWIARANWKDHDYQSRLRA